MRVVRSVSPIESPAAIKSAMLTSATNLDNTGNVTTLEESGEAGTVHVVQSPIVAMVYDPKIERTKIVSHKLAL
uniref:Uncharacterized protein n=1 Tax=Physcomitrium patens TaxID=3218 RepID=A0A2K1KQE3_PHYPA|nr:hypothetical protein PHYPA_006901 [Physcomitrium patens]